jgi:hypothetical protein
LVLDPVEPITQFANSRRRAACDDERGDRQYGQNESHRGIGGGEMELPYGAW